jgi:hypothetical protein
MIPVDRGVAPCMVWVTPVAARTTARATVRDVAGIARPLAVACEASPSARGITPTAEPTYREVVMPRAAGTGPRYEWHLLDVTTGNYRPTERIELVSVTTVINAILAKPQLYKWNFNVGLDLVSGLVDVLWNEDERLEDERELIDTFTDADMLREYMIENDLTPDIVAQQASTRGDQTHELLDRIARCSKKTPEAALKLAARQFEDPASSPSDRAVCQWWMEEKPEVIASEIIVKSLQHGYAGSLDLLWRDQDGDVVLTDLKTRREDLDAYDSDKIQIGAYEMAVAETMGLVPDRLSVLLAGLDGSYREVDSDLEGGAIFLNLLDVYNKLYS